MNRLSCRSAISAKLIFFIEIFLLWLFFSPILSSASETRPTRELIIGIYAPHGIRASVTQFTPLAEQASEVLGQPVRIEASPDNVNFWEKLRAGYYALVYYNPYQYVRSHHDYGYQAIARSETDAGGLVTIGVHVMKDSGIESLAQLKGRRVMFGGHRGSMLGYIVPTYLMRQAGLKAGDYQEAFARSPASALIATYLRKADAAAANPKVLDTPMVSDICDTAQLRQLAISLPLANYTWAVSPQLSPQWVQRMRKFLLGLSHSRDGRAVLKQAGLRDIVAATDADYLEHRKIIKAVLKQQY